MENLQAALYDVVNNVKMYMRGYKSSNTLIFQHISMRQRTRGLSTHSWVSQSLPTQDFFCRWPLDSDHINFK